MSLNSSVTLQNQCEKGSQPTRKKTGKNSNTAEQEKKKPITGKTTPPPPQDGQQYRPQARREVWRTKTASRYSRRAIEGCLPRARQKICEMGSAKGEPER